MSNCINEIDVIVQCVKNIVDSVRCVICDRLEGSRMRYPCGHVSCHGCAVDAEDCPICFRAINFVTLDYTVHDGPLSKRVKHASKLLNMFQDEFNIDVYRRRRISEKLKTERELFPKCIQAPAKYCNKRKSMNTSISLKREKKLSVPIGQNIPSQRIPDMENSRQYVQEWLNKHDSNNTDNSCRQPFSNLSVNSFILDRNNTEVINKRKKSKENKVHKLKSMNRKRTLKSTISPIVSHSSHSQIVTKLENAMKGCNKFIQMKIEYSRNSKHDVARTKHDEDESGIVINDDETIIIDDTPKEIVDKDKQAWLSVLEADKFEAHNLAPKVMLDKEMERRTHVVENTFSNTLEYENCNEYNTYAKSVPFYKKSLIFESCKYCKETDFASRNVNFIKVNNPRSDVSLTVENSNVITTIKMSNLDQNDTRISIRNSIGIQTDTIFAVENTCIVDKDKENSDIFIEKDEILNSHVDNGGYETPYNNEENNNLKRNLNKLCKDNSVLFGESIYIKNKGIIIEDSDSDMDTEQNSQLQVTADVHRSSDDFADHVTLTELKQNDHGYRIRRRPRGQTPASTDSSDKENLDPNRVRKLELRKKSLGKKHKL